MALWECKRCLYVYDEDRGIPEEGISSGTKWEDLSEDWVCPDCGVGKAKFGSILGLSYPANKTFS